MPVPPEVLLQLAEDGDDAGLHPSLDLALHPAERRIGEHGFLPSADDFDSLLVNRDDIAAYLILATRPWVGNF
jgi:hypothetical protein